MRQRGFTLVEMLVIAPIVILSIGAFIAAIVSMTGEVLSSRGANSLTYDVQDALNRIEQDVKLSTTFLAQTSIEFTASNPQGQGAVGSTDPFVNVGGSSQPVLILAALVPNGNPLVSGTGNLYLKDEPYDCSNATLYTTNRPLLMNIVYFIDDRGDADPANDTLWRRTIMPAEYANASLLCGGSSWYMPSCQPGYVSSFCKTQDMKLVEGITAEQFEVAYYSTASSTTASVVAVDTGSSSAQRAAALQGLQTVEVNLTASKQIAGRAVERTGSVRATRLATNATAIANIVNPDVAALSPVVTASVVDGSDVVFDWTVVQGAARYEIDYRINGGSWVSAATNLPATTRTYKVTAAVNNNTVEARVRAYNANSQASSYGTGSVQIPLWAPLQLRYAWRYYGTPYAIPSYTLTSDGMVVLKGLIRDGTNGEIAILPAKYRPTYGGLIFLSSSNGAGRVDIRQDGTVFASVYSSAVLTLDNIMFAGPTKAMTATSKLNSWVYFGAGSGNWADSAYNVNAQGRIFTAGLVANGSTSSPSMVSMPVGARPVEYHHIAQYPSTAAGYHVSIRHDNGAIDYKGGGNSFVSVVGTYYGSTRTTNANCTLGWCTLGLSNGWLAYGSVYTAPAYTKGSDGIVSLKGLVRAGALGTVAPTLPTGYCPSERLLFAAVSADTLARIDIVPTGGGACRVEANPASSTWLSLDNIHYVAE